MLYRLNTTQILAYMASGGVGAVRRCIDRLEKLNLDDLVRKAAPRLRRQPRSFFEFPSPNDTGRASRQPLPTRSRHNDGPDHFFSPDAATSPPPQAEPSAPGVSHPDPVPPSASPRLGVTSPDGQPPHRPRPRKYRHDHRIFVATLRLLFTLLAGIAHLSFWWIYVLVLRPVIPPSNNPNPLAPPAPDTVIAPEERTTESSGQPHDHSHSLRVFCGRCEKVMTMASVMAASASIASSLGSWLSSSSSSQYQEDDDEDASLEDTFRGRRVMPRVRLMEPIEALRLSTPSPLSPTSTAFSGTRTVVAASTRKLTKSLKRVDFGLRMGTRFESLQSLVAIVPAYLAFRDELDLARLEDVVLVSAEEVLEAIQHGQWDTDADAEEAESSTSNVDDVDAGSTPPTSPEKDDAPAVSDLCRGQVIFEGVTLIASPQGEKSVKEDTVTVLFDADQEEELLENMRSEVLRQEGTDIASLQKVDRAVQTDPIDVESMHKPTRFGSLFEFSKMVYERDSDADEKQLVVRGGPGGSRLEADAILEQHKDVERDLGLTPSVSDSREGNLSPVVSQDGSPALLSTPYGGSPAISCSPGDLSGPGSLQYSDGGYPFGSNASALASLPSLSGVSADDGGRFGSSVYSHSSTMRPRSQAPLSSHGDFSDDEAEDEPTADATLDSDDENEQPRPGVETKEVWEAGEMLKRWTLKDDSGGSAHSSQGKDLKPNGPGEGGCSEVAIDLLPEGKQRSRPVQKGKEPVIPGKCNQKAIGHGQDVEGDILYESGAHGMPLSAPPSFEATSSDSIIVDDLFNNVSMDKTPKREGKQHLKADAIPFIPITVVPPSPDTFRPQPHLPRRPPPAPVKQQPKPALNPGARTFTPRRSCSSQMLTPPHVVPPIYRAPALRNGTGVQPPPVRQGLPPLPLQQMPPRIPFTPTSGAGDVNLSQPRPLVRCTATKSLPSLSTVPFFSPRTPQNSAVPIVAPPKRPSRRGGRKRTLSGNSSDFWDEMYESDGSKSMSDLGEGPPIIPVIPEKAAAPSVTRNQEVQGRDAVRRGSNSIPNWALICQAAQAKQ